MIGSQIANYRIVAKLGEGGMGVVYQAIDVNLDRPVAIKLISAELAHDPALVERFQSEAKAQARLIHPNIATLYTFLIVEGNCMMVMEFLEGETLDQIVHRRGAVAWREASPIFKQALLGIGFAHRAGIIHRDIKPSNIMVTRGGMVKVMDFGIAKVLGDRRLTRTGAKMGTVAYMSPEQIRNQPVDARSDIYSLGVTLFEILTAHLPFEGESDFQLMSDHVSTPPPRLSRFNRQVPPGIDDVVLQAMAKSPAERFQTAEAFGAALEQAERFPMAVRQQPKESVAARRQSPQPSRVAPPPPPPARAPSPAPQPRPLAVAPPERKLGTFGDRVSSGTTGARGGRKTWLIGVWAIIVAALYIAAQQLWQGQLVEAFVALGLAVIGSFFALRWGQASGA